MRRVIIPTDFSENSIVGIHYALELYGTKEVKYFLVNSVEPPQGRATVFRSLIDKMDEQSREELLELKNKISEDLKLEGLDMECVTVHGDMMSNVEDLVQEFQATYIFMGTKGRSNAVEKFIGSNTFKVLKNVQCPVFIVPKNIEVKKPKKIGLATDLSEIDEVLVNRIIQFAKDQNAKIEIINFRMSDDPVAQKSVDTYESHFSSITHEFHFVKGNDIAEDLNNFATQKDIDVMIMVRHEHNFFERMFVPSSTRKMVLVTEIPLLVLSE